MRALGLLGLIACACGPGLLVGEDEGGSEGGSAGPDGADVTGSDGGVDGGDDAPGLDDGADAGDDGPDDDPDDGPDVPEPIGLCDVAGSDVLAVTIAEAEARIVRGDGSTVALDVAPLAEPAGAHVTHFATASADTVAVVISWTLLERGISHGFTLRVFDADGAVSWERQETGASLGAVALGEDGSIAATRYLDDGQTQGVLYTGPDAAFSLGSVQPIGPLGADGLVPGRMPQDDTPGALGWFHTDAGAFVPVTATASNGWYQQREGALVYQTETAIVVEHPDEVATIELGEHATSTVSSSNGEWLLLRDTEGVSWGRVSLATHVVEAVQIAPPPGFSFLECYFLNGSIDRTGHVYAPTRNATLARVQRLDPRTQTWDAVGEPVTRIDNLEVFATGDTVILHSHAENTTFCPPQTFDPVEDVFQGETWQVAGPDGQSYLLPQAAGWVSPNVAGTCVHYASETGAVVLDVRSGDTLELPAPVYVLR